MQRLVKVKINTEKYFKVFQSIFGHVDAKSASAKKVPDGRYFSNGKYISDSEGSG